MGFNFDSPSTDLQDEAIDSSSSDLQEEFLFFLHKDATAYTHLHP